MRPCLAESLKVISHQCICQSPPSPTEGTLALPQLPVGSKHLIKIINHFLKFQHKEPMHCVVTETDQKGPDIFPPQSVCHIYVFISAAMNNIPNIIWGE